MTTTDTLPMPAHRTKEGFPLDACTRCGGSGAYSYNAMHGSRCYGCGGTGWKIAAGAAKAQAAFQLEQRRGWEVTANPTPHENATTGTIAIGDEINRQKGDPWQVVAAIDIDYSQPCGWSGTISADTATAWRGTITFTDGDTWNIMTNAMYRRRRVTDPTPYVEEALRHWRRKGCKGGTK